jgi:hypothetical protein
MLRRSYCTAALSPACASPSRQSAWYYEGHVGLLQRDVDQQKLNLLLKTVNVLSQQMFHNEH